MHTKRDIGVENGFLLPLNWYTVLPLCYHDKLEWSSINIDVFANIFLSIYLLSTEVLRYGNRIRNQLWQKDIRAYYCTIFLLAGIWNMVFFSKVRVSVIKANETFFYRFWIIFHIPHEYAVNMADCLYFCLRSKAHILEFRTGCIAGLAQMEDLPSGSQSWQCVTIHFRYFKLIGRGDMRSKPKS